MISRFSTLKRTAGLLGVKRSPVSLTMNRYSPRLFFFLVLLVGLNSLDSYFTLIILEKGGRELNPIVNMIMNILGEKFWIWKFFVVSICSVILCLNSRKKIVKISIVLVCFLYLGLISYQIIGLNIPKF